MVKKYNKDIKSKAGKNFNDNKVLYDGDKYYKKHAKIIQKDF